jgi:hypothetical protein
MAPCCIFIAYRRYKKYKRKQNETEFSTESTDIELAVNSQPEENSNQGNYRLNTSSNNNMDPEYCDPLPLYTPPSSSQISQTPLRANEDRYKAPPYSVSP